ncbi:MAG: stationary phase survival protein SurE [Sphingobacteriales bacterium]|nr:MAG: stationary phase survival protein SurE [Sphingobacteriales bacterium]TAF82690.1 MAG: stationary phase survival protein SurE [Sphingobacteriales bacterium]
MFKKDNVWIGLALGLVLPALGFLIVQLLKRNFTFLGKADLLYIGCVAINLWLLKLAYKKEMEASAKGIISATFVCALLFFYYKVQKG